MLGSNAVLPLYHADISNVEPSCSSFVPAPRPLAVGLVEPLVMRGDATPKKWTGCRTALSIGPDFGNGAILERFWENAIVRRSGTSESRARCPALDCDLSLRFPGVHASVRGQRSGCQHHAVSMQLRFAHLTCALARRGGNSQSRGITGTTSLGDLGGSRPAGSGQGSQAVTVLTAQCVAGMSYRFPTCSGARPRSGGRAPPSRACCRGAW